MCNGVCMSDLFIIHHGEKRYMGPKSFQSFGVHEIVLIHWNPHILRNKIRKMNITQYS